MNMTPTPTPIPTPPPPVVVKEPPKGNPLTVILIVFAGLATVGALLLTGYLFAVNGGRIPFLASVPTPTPIPSGITQVTCTMEAKICPDGSSVGRTGPSCEFAPCPTNTPPSTIATASAATPRPTPIVVPNPTGKTYISNLLGLAFYYGTKMLGGNESISVKEVGNKVFVYPVTMDATKGQSVEMFEKNPNDTLAQAIEKKFLVGIPKTDCFVEAGSPRSDGVEAGKKNVDKNIETATISYPVPENAEEPAFTFGDKCPEKYRSSNGIAYFWYNRQYPSKFFYFSIGQYGIPAHDGDENSMWQDTFVVLK